MTGAPCRCTPTAVVPCCASPRMPPTPCRTRSSSPSGAGSRTRASSVPGCTRSPGWDGQLTVRVRMRVSRHIGRCEICGEHMRRELSPAMFDGAVPMVALMPVFREHVLRVCADRTSAGWRSARAWRRVRAHGLSRVDEPARRAGLAARPALSRRGGRHRHGGGGGRSRRGAVHRTYIARPDARGRGPRQRGGRQ
jgi:hypothetical protein